MSNLSDNPNLIVEKFYADDFKEKPDNYDNRHTQRLRQTLEHLKSYNIKNQVVCDMGCGSGWFLKNLD